jgi:hypothetical protein
MSTMSLSGFLRFGGRYFWTSLTLSISIVLSGARVDGHIAAFLAYAVAGNALPSSGTAQRLGGRPLGLTGEPSGGALSWLANV